jgi:hypothetical protein
MKTQQQSAPQCFMMLHASAKTLSMQVALNAAQAN